MANHTAPIKTLTEDLSAAIHEYAEYVHPCDSDARNLNKATGTIPIHVLREILRAHGEEI